MRAILSFVIVLLLTGCGTERTEAQHREAEKKTATKETTTVSHPDGSATVSVRVFEQIEQEQSAQEIHGKTEIRAPEVGTVLKVAAGVAKRATPGIGDLVSLGLAWLTGTPDGAALGLAGATTLAAGGLGAMRRRQQKRTDDEEREMLSKDFDLVVKATSDYMQENPQQAEALKDAHSRTQDRATKDRVRASRAKQGLM